MEHEVEHLSEEYKFQINLEGHAAVLEYTVKNEQIFLLHTEVPQEIRGRGVGEILAKYALQHGKKNYKGLIIYCPFVKAYSRKHPNWRNEL